jgi:hypothetical protein
MPRIPNPKQRIAKHKVAEFLPIYRGSIADFQTTNFEQFFGLSASA